MPEKDTTQNVEDVSGDVTNGITRVQFTRAIDTGDGKEDFIFNETNCAFVLFSWGGNVYESGNDVILAQHIDQKVSDEELCLQSCGQQGNNTVLRIYRTTLVLKSIPI